MNTQLVRPVSFWSVACCSHAAHLALSLDHFAFAASHSSAVHFSTSATVEDTVLGSAAVDGEAVVDDEFGAGDDDGVCAKTIPTQMNPARATADRQTQV
jgi:hypothetical protein